ncbi:hypothetical protein SAMN04488020_11726 [Palleronia marisminoris]|uniref:Uncharacterized protein n=1 Tax=Palleronia marisminoris TaxID=315423 RepID=A0A1Y5TQN5_9RHOB|nr:hypothetical protein [Palleronia marisminoris]SFH48945.1 hypothetical protein SAMN04488020_11726 [Palleronia marisminoris]SLN69604.1 hypothetical protein PAM7066_03528 [Palleronia marisminoris]
MRSRTSNIIQLSAAAAIAYGLSAIPPVAAQTIVNMPTLQFPTKNGSWGCRFTERCTIAAPGLSDKM